MKNRENPINSRRNFKLALLVIKSLPHVVGTQRKIAVNVLCLSFKGLLPINHPVEKNDSPLPWNNVEDKTLGRMNRTPVLSD